MKVRVVGEKRSREEPGEKAKIELSQVQSKQINLPFITANADGPLHLDETLSRSK